MSIIHINTANNFKVRQFASGVKLYLPTTYQYTGFIHERSEVPEVGWKQRYTVSKLVMNERRDSPDLNVAPPIYAKEHDWHKPHASWRGDIFIGAYSLAEVFGLANIYASPNNRRNGPRSSPENYDLTFTNMYELQTVLWTIYEAILLQQAKHVEYIGAEDMYTVGLLPLYFHKRSDKEEEEFLDTLQFENSCLEYFEEDRIGHGLYQYGILVDPSALPFVGHMFKDITEMFYPLGDFCIMQKPSGEIYAEGTTPFRHHDTFQANGMMYDGAVQLTDIAPIADDDTDVASIIPTVIRDMRDMILNDWYDYYTSVMAIRPMYKTVPSVGYIIDDSFNSEGMIQW